MNIEHRARLSQSFRDGQTLAQIFDAWGRDQTWCSRGRHWWTGPPWVARKSLTCPTHRSVLHSPRGHTG